MGGDWAATAFGTRMPPCPGNRRYFEGMDGAHWSIIAASASQIRQMEQRFPPLPTMGRDRRIRGDARNFGRTRRTESKRRHARRHHRPGTSLCVQHKKGTKTQAPGRSRAGFVTKLHARYDAQRRPLGFIMMSGQTHDN